MGTVVNGNKWAGACVDGNIVSGLVKNGIVFYKKTDTKLNYSMLRITNISVKTSDGNWSQYAKTDDIVRIILYLNETSYSSLKLSVNNVTAGNLTYDNNMQAYRYDYKIKSTDTQFNFTITGYNDSGVNVGYLTELDANHSTQNYIVIDNSSPEIILPESDSTMDNIPYYLTAITPTINETNIDFITLTKNEEDVTYTNGNSISESGVYVLTVTDKAGNNNSVTFGIDVTAPVFTNIHNGKIVEGGTIEVSDDNFYYMTVKNTKTGITETLYENVFTFPNEDADNVRYDVEAYDKFNNKSPGINVYHDNVSPLIEGTGTVSNNEVNLENNGIYKSVALKVTDGSLKKVVRVNSDSEEVLSTFNDNYTNNKLVYEEEFTEVGTYTIKATDRIGHISTITFEIN